MRELTLPGRLILIPGFGCGPAIFDHQRKAFGDRLETPAFIPHHPNESVAAYAQRWAHQLSRPGDGRPLFVGGISFGGMLAQEMSMVLEPKPRAVLLMATPRQADQVSSIMQFAELLGRWVPMRSVNKTLALLNLALALREGLDDDDKQRLMDAGRHIDSALAKWSAFAAVGWSGYDPPAGYPPVHQIHSRRDWVIKPPVDTPGVRWLDGSSHLVHMTHRRTLNRFLFDAMLEHCPEARSETPAIEDPDTTAQRRLVLEGAPAGTPMV